MINILNSLYRFLIYYSFTMENLTSKNIKNSIQNDQKTDIKMRFKSMYCIFEDDALQKIA